VKIILPITRAQTLQGANLAGRKPCAPTGNLRSPSGGSLRTSPLGRLSLRASPGNFNLRKSHKNLAKLDWYTINLQVPYG